MDNKLLKTVWEKVHEDYKKRLINSERCLQAVLYKSFREELKDENIFVEPVIEYYDNQIHHSGNRQV